MTTVAQISDLHVLDVRGVPASRFLNKRITGAINLMVGRRNAHPARIQEALVEDLLEQEPDHVVVTGDLTNLALETEFEAARRLLAPLGGAERLSMVPGNHDIYTRGAERSDRFERYFADWLWQGNLPRRGDRYPWYKRVGEVHLVGLCSAVPRLPLFAHGLVGRRQLRRLKRLSAQHGFHDGYTVVLIHHNLHRRGARKDWMHGLDDRDRVLDACREAGVDLVLHGHTHVAHRFRWGRLRVIGCGSSTWDSTHPSHVARYNVYRVADGSLDSVEVRAWDHASGRFVQRTTLTPEEL